MWVVVLLKRRDREQSREGISEDVVSGCQMVNGQKVMPDAISHYSRLLVKGKVIITHIPSRSVCNKYHLKAQSNSTVKEFRFGN